MRSSKYALIAAAILMTLTACGGGSSTSSWPTSSQPVAAAYIQSVAFRNHTAMAWGSNGYGQLGNGNSGNSLTPVPVTGAPRLVEIATGGTHTVAVDMGSTVWTWGNNGYGQLGSGTVTARYQPAKVFKNSTSAHTYLTNITNVSSGGNHTLALDATGTVWAWGANTWGQVGYDTTTLGYSMTAWPVQNLPLGGFKATLIAAGGGHSLALDYSGSVWSWGNNYEGQLGNGTAVNSGVPVQVVIGSGLGVLKNVVAIAAGGSHSVAVVTDGSADTTKNMVISWGYNNYGQLGNNSQVNSLIPVPVVDGNNIPLTGVIAIAAGANHTLALKSDGTVWSWGYNGWGQLGIGTTVDSHVAVRVPGLSFIDRISAAGNHTLVFFGGTAWSWGDNAYGQLGLNSTNYVMTPTQLTGAGYRSGLFP